MKNGPRIQVIIHEPKTEKGKYALEKRVSEVYADFVIHTINKLNCPVKQKLELLQAIIDAQKEGGNQKNRRE